MAPRLLLLTVLAAALSLNAADPALGGVKQTPGSDANLIKAQLKASFIRHHGFWDVCAFLYNHFDDGDGDDDGQGWCSTPAKAECYLNARSFRATINLASIAASFDTAAVGDALSTAASGKSGTTCALFEDFAVTFTLSSAHSSSVNSTTTDGGEQGDGGHGHRAPHWDTVDADGNIPVTDGAFLLPVPGINTSLRVHLDLQQGNQSVTATLTGFVAASGGNVLGAATLADLVPTILLLGSQWAATVGKHEQTVVITSAPVLAASFIIRASAPVTAGNALTRLTTAVDAGALGAAITKASPAATPAGITFAQNPTAPVRVLVPITLSAGANGTAGDFNASSLGGAPGSQVAVIVTTSFTLNVTTAGGANASAIAGAVQQGVSDSLHVPPDAVDVTVAPSTPADNSSSPNTGAVTSVVTVTIQHGSIGDITLPGNSSDALAPSAAPAGADGGINSTATTPDATPTPTAVPVTASSESTVAVPAGNSTDAAAAPAAPAAAPVANLTAFTASVQDIIQNTVPQAVQAALAADNVANATVQAPTSADGISTSASAAVPLAGSDVSAAAQVASTQQRSGAGGGSPISTPSAPPPSVPPPPAGLLVASTLPHSGATTPACGVAAVLAVLTAVVGAAM